MWEWNRIQRLKGTWGQSRPKALGSWVLLSFRHGILPHAKEIALVVGAYFAYMYTRQLAFPNVEAQAFVNAVRVVEFEKGIRLFWEVAFQNWMLDHARFAIHVLNWAYVITFWPIVLTTALIFYFVDRNTYRIYRSILLLSFGVALVVFMLFPLAPPRFVHWEGFVDTVKAFGPGFYSNREAQSYFNAYAAMPSIHFGWTVLFGYLFYQTGIRWLKVAAILYPAITLVAIVGTGNHYIVDSLGGIGVILTAALLYRFVIRRRPLERPSFALGKRPLPTV